MKDLLTDRRMNKRTNEQTFVIVIEVGKKGRRTHLVEFVSHG